MKGSGTASHGRGSGLAIPHELVVLEKDRNCSVMDQVLLQAWVWAARLKEESWPFMKPLDGHDSCYHWFELQLLGLLGLDEDSIRYGQHDGHGL